MINDKIEPMGFDLTKNLHGHVRVETRDRWTGRVVDSQEKDNLVTNAVQKMIMLAAWLGAGSSVSGTCFGKMLSPLYSKALGSILLFNSTLTESADNISFPPNAKLVAYAGQISNTMDANAGSYNASESTAISNGFTTVWDFLTSQANGTIASIGRTSHWFAEGQPYAARSTGTVAPALDRMTGANSSSLGLLGYDATNNYLYYTPASTETISGITYTINSIVRAKVDFSKIHLVNALPPVSETTLIKNVSSSDGSQYGYYWRYDPYENNFVFITGTTIHLLAMDGTHTTKTATGTSGSNFVVTQNYYWRTTGSTVYRIEKANTANIQSFAITNNGDQIGSTRSDVVFTWKSAATTPYAIVYPDGTVVYISSSINSRPDNSSFFAGDTLVTGWLSFFPVSNYLGTIANLDSPVTKTSSQTMKITYTLTEA